VTPRPEKIEAPKRKRRAPQRMVKPKAKKPGGPDDTGGTPPRSGSPVPKVPLVRA
jgi:ATP-dependent Clp protease ATP-binding subunit ClpA